MAELAALRTAKQAMDENLIGQQDFDVIKVAFLKAQQIKAGLDAGFIRQSDYDKARDAYLHALDFSIMSSFPTTVPPPTSRPPTARTASGPSSTGPPSPRLPQGTLYDVAADTAAAAANILSASPSRSSSMNGNSALPTAPAPVAVPTPAVAAAAPTAAAATSAAVAAPAAPAPAAMAPQLTTAAPQTAPASVSGLPSVQTTPRSSGSSGLLDIPSDLPQYAKGSTNGKVSMAGIGIKEECVNLFMHMKTRSAYKWITFKVDDTGRYVVPDKLGGKSSTYSEFVESIPDGQCRYGVFDYEYTSPERGNFNKLVFVNWAPEGCNIRTKMMFASTKDFFKGFLDGVQAELQATERAEMTEEEMKERVVANMTRK